MTFHDSLLTETGKRLGLIAYDIGDELLMVQQCYCDAEPNESIDACSLCNTPYILGKL